eukprot:c20774_g1_i1.p1 GENE.c20774_g1_i1~~c20774_g1_i1.p1  ORF type:complete len:589 (+),score=120.73 c20774_g1_i1:22-1767(+)
MTARDPNKLRTLFDQFDPDSRGTIGPEALQKVLAMPSLCLSESDQREAFGTANLNSAGDIEFEEFVKLVSARPVTDPESSKRLFANVPCEKCGKNVKFIEKFEFQGKVFHNGCLGCSRCAQSLLPSRVAEFGGEMFCVGCDPGKAKRNSLRASMKGLNISALILKRCPRCNEKVEPKDQMADGIEWHKSCFTCKDCSKPLMPQLKEDLEGEVYCKICHRKRTGVANVNSTTDSNGSVTARILATKVCCPRCTKQVMWRETVIGPSGASWHKTCFSCKLCSKRLNVELAEEKDQEVYCKPCFRKEFGAIPFRTVTVGGTKTCPRCSTGVTWKEAIVGPTGVPWHIKCFTCNTCQRSLNVEYTEQRDGEVYCKPCYNKDLRSQNNVSNREKTGIEDNAVCVCQPPNENIRLAIKSPNSKVIELTGVSFSNHPWALEPPGRYEGSAFVGTTLISSFTIEKKANGTLQPEVLKLPVTEISIKLASHDQEHANELAIVNCRIGQCETEIQTVTSEAGSVSVLADELSKVQITLPNIGKTTSFVVPKADVKTKVTQVLDDIPVSVVENTGGSMLTLCCSCSSFSLDP